MYANEVGGASGQVRLKSDSNATDRLQAESKPTIHPVNKAPWADFLQTSGVHSECRPHRFDYPQCIAKWCDVVVFPVAH